MGNFQEKEEGEREGKTLLNISFAKARMKKETATRMRLARRRKGTERNKSKGGNWNSRNKVPLPLISLRKPPNSTNAIQPGPARPALASYTYVLTIVIKGGEINKEAGMTGTRGKKEGREVKEAAQKQRRQVARQGQLMGSMLNARIGREAEQAT